MEIFLKLLIAHILSDFFLQPSLWVLEKRKSPGKSKFFYFHLLITGILAYAALGRWENWVYILFLVGTHGLIDYFKLKYFDEGLWPFLIDQFLHIAILAGLAIHITFGSLDVGLWFTNIDVKTWAILSGYLWISLPSGFLVGKATQKWQMELAPNEASRDSLQNAGIWIGILERVLVLTFVLASQFQAIGFLIAAKSILRFSDKNEDFPRKQTEYVLIGTFISFSLALFTGLAINALVN